MDNDQLKDKFNKFRSEVRLSEERKKTLKEDLVQFMAVSEIEAHGSEARRFKPVRPSAFQRVAMPAFAVMAIVAIVGGSASFAAQNALPGDILYPMKVDFNEKVAGAFQISPEAQANYEVELAERRLTEAAELAARGRMSAKKEAEIESRFEEHSKNAEARIKKVEVDGDINAAADAVSRFEAALNAHEEILAKLEAKDSRVAEIKAGVQSRLGKAKGARLDLEAKVVASSEIAGAAPMSLQAESATNTTSKSGEAQVKADSKAKAKMKTAAEVRIKAATKAIASLRSYIEKKKERLDAEAVVESEAKISTAEKLIVEARSKVEAGAYGEAFNFGNQAISLTQGIRTVLEANAWLNERIERDAKDDREDEDKKESDQEVRSETNIDTNVSGNVGVNASGVRVNTNIDVNVGGGVNLGL